MSKFLCWAVVLGSILWLRDLPALSQIASTPSGAKPAEAKTAEVKPDFSKEAFVDEEDITKLVFENDGTSTRENSVRIRVQSEAGVQRYGVLTFAYQNATESLDIDFVQVHKPDGTVITTPPENIQDMAAQITREAPFYSDLREKQVAVKGLSVGDVLESKVRWRVSKPLAPGQFWFSFNLPRDFIVLHQVVQASVPHDRAIKWRSPSLKPVITEEGSRRIFTWTSSQLEHKSAEQEKKDQEEQLYQASRGKLPAADVQLSSFQSWAEVGSWYNSLQRERVKPSAEIQAKAAELVKGKASDDEKMRAIYSYVSTRFHYIGVAFGIGRYQPHSAAEVLSNQFGDCKDKHTLLASLLEAAGIKAYPVLINSVRDLDPDVPSPLQFDHLITAVPQGNGFLWLDTTAEVAPFGYLMGILRDKPALVIPAESPSVMVTTAANPPSKTLEAFKIDAKLKDDGTLEGKVERTVSGNDVEILMRGAFRRVPLPNWKDLVQQISYNSGFAGDVSEVTASPAEKTDEPFHFSYTYNRKDYPQWSERRISSPLPPMLAPAPDTQPGHPILLGDTGEYRYESRVELPPGFSPQLPANLELKQDFGEYRVRYSVKGSVLQTERTLTIKLREVPVSEYETYKKFNKAVSDDHEVYVALSSDTSGANPVQTAMANLPASDNAEAMGAFAAGISKGRSGNLPGAIDSFNEAVKADPKFARAWMALVSAYAASGQQDMIVPTLRRAHEAAPHQPLFYQMLVQELLREDEYDEAISVLQDLVKTEPPSSDILSILGSAFFKAESYDEAATAIESAIKLAPDRARLYLQLASAYSHGRKQDKALAAYKKAIELDSSPTMLNDVGYVMADANENLPLSLEYAEKAAHAEEESTAEIKLSHLTSEDLGTVSSVTAFWDTLGWVYFRMGKLEQAERYLRAAWVVSQNPTNADHLGQVYEQQHKKEDAMRMYRLALITSPKRHEMMDTQERLARLGGTATLGRSEANGREELNRLRTVMLPKICSETASAEFFLLFGPGSKVEEVKFVNGSEKLKSADKALSSAVFDMPFPDDGPTRLVRRGVLNCSSITGCIFVLYTPDTVRSVN